MPADELSQDQRSLHVQEQAGTPEGWGQPSGHQVEGRAGWASA